MTTCINCHHWQLKASPLARAGMASCAHLPRWEHYPPQHTCARHKAIEQSAADARVLFIGRLDQKHNNKRTA